MEQITKKERLSTTIVGRIAGTEVNINFENNVGEAPLSINANCFIQETAEAGTNASSMGMPIPGTNISITRQTNGQKSVTISGTKAVAAFAELIEEIEMELETIAITGGVE